jgi:peptide/nickel transport system substrate-binding protein
VNRYSARELTAHRLATGRRYGLRRVVAAAAALALAALAAACGSSGTSTSASSSTNATLTVATGVAPSSLDPCAGDEGGDFPYADLIYAVPSTGALTPGIATSWGFSGPNKETFRMKIRSGLTFQDGTKVDAQAVVTSIEHCVGEKLNTIPTMTGITAVGANTVQISLNAPTASLPGVLASRIGYIISPAAIKKYGRFLDTHPVGAGPFKLVSYTPGTSIKLARFDGYKFAGSPAAKVAQIDVQIISNPNSVVSALTSGAAQYAFGLSATQLGSIRSDPSLHYYSSSTALALDEVFINPKLKPMSNLDVRLALEYAINRKALAAAASDGLQDEPAYTPYAPNSPYGEASTANMFPYNPATAKALLAAAGYPHGLTLTAVAINTPPESTDATVVAADLAKIGITLKLTIGPGVQVNTQFNTSNAADLFFTGWCCTVTPFLTYQLSYSPSSSFTGDHPAAMATPVNSMNTAYTSSALQAAIDAANAVLKDQAPTIPLYYSPEYDAYTSSVHGEASAYSVTDEPDLVYLSVG